LDSSFDPASYHDAADDRERELDASVDGGGVDDMDVASSVPSSAGDDVLMSVASSHSWLRRRSHGPATDTATALAPLPPSADEALLHRRASELRLALRVAEDALDKTRTRLETAEEARHEAEAEAVALRARVWTLEGAEALSGARLHDGSLDLLRGELLNEATEELEEAAKAANEAEERALKAVASLQQAEEAAAAVAAAANGEVETLSLEAAQARFRAQAEARDAAAARDAMKRAEDKQHEAELDAAKWREIGDRETIRSSNAEEEARRYKVEAEEAREAAAVSLARETDAVQHNNWLQQRVNALEEAEGNDAGAHYGEELRRVREKLTADAAKAADDLAAERSRRRALEAVLVEAGIADVAAAAAAAEAGATSAVAELEAQLAKAREEKDAMKRALDAATAAVNARSVKSSQDSWADALGLEANDGDAASEEDEPKKKDTATETEPPMTEEEEKDAKDVLLETAQKELAELQEVNKRLVMAREAHAEQVAASAAASTAAVDAALKRNNQAWAIKVAEAERAIAIAEENATAALDRLAVMEAECEAANKELEGVHSREIAVEKLEASVAIAAEDAKKKEEALAAREAEAVEAEKEWEEKLTEARQAAAAAESKLADAETKLAQAVEDAAEAKRAAAESIAQVEEEREREVAEAEKEWEEKLTEARQATAEAEAKLARAERLAQEAMEESDHALLRADELEKERDGAQQELDLMREREATAELAAEAEVAFAALEAGEEAKMEAAEALAQARAEAATVRDELDALRESIRIEHHRETPPPTVRRVPPSPTMTPRGSVLDEPTKSSESPVRPSGVTVVQMMTDDECESEAAVMEPLSEDESPMEYKTRMRNDRDTDADSAGTNTPNSGAFLTRPRFASHNSSPALPSTPLLAKFAAVASPDPTGPEMRSKRDSPQSDATDMDVSEPESAAGGARNDGQWVWHPRKSEAQSTPTRASRKAIEAAEAAAKAARAADAAAEAAAETATRSKVARRLDVDNNEALRSLTSRRAQGRRSTPLRRGGASSSDEDDLCRMSDSDDESTPPTARGRHRRAATRRHRERSASPPREPKRSHSPERRHRSSTDAAWGEDRVARESNDSVTNVNHAASEAFAAVAASAHAAAEAASQALRGNSRNASRANSRGSSAHATPKPSPAKLAAAAFNAASPLTPSANRRSTSYIVERSIREGEATLQAMRASRATLASKSPALKQRRVSVADKTTASRAAKAHPPLTPETSRKSLSTSRSHASDPFGRPTGTWGRPSPSPVRPTAISSGAVKTSRHNHRYA